MGRKRKASKAKRSILKVLVGLIGRRMIRRVQRKSLRSITDRPGAKRSKVALPAALSRMATRMPQRKARPVVAPPAPTPRSRRLGRLASPKVGKGLAFALFSAAAVAAVKVGVDHVVEAERDQHVVTPDFDVFGDDDE